MFEQRTLNYDPEIHEEYLNNSNKHKTGALRFFFFKNLTT